MGVEEGRLRMGKILRPYIDVGSAGTVAGSTRVAGDQPAWLGINPNRVTMVVREGNRMKPKMLIGSDLGDGVKAARSGRIRRRGVA
jgi:hypothetical protein